MAEPPEQPAVVPGEDVARRYALEQTRMSLESGYLGKLFGSAANAPTNIAGFVVCLLVIISVVVLFLPSKMPVDEFLKLILPVITLVLGYLFGKKTNGQ
jgi:hypothetical protein